MARPLVRREPVEPAANPQHARKVPAVKRLWPWGVQFASGELKLALGRGEFIGHSPYTPQSVHSFPNYEHKPASTGGRVAGRLASVHFAGKLLMR